MKRTIGILAIVLVAVVCFGMGSLPGWIPTNALPTPPDQPAVTNTPAVLPQPSGSAFRGVVAAGEFARPSLAIAGDGRIFLSAEGAGMGSIYTWTLAPGSSSWKGGLAIAGTRGGPADAGRVYIPSTLANGLTGCRLGPKEWGTMHGPGLILQAPGGQTTFRFTKFTVGAPRLAAWGGHSYMLTKNGAWAELDAAGGFIRTGTWPAGDTGEKFAISIGPDGRWHTAMNGYSLQDASYATGPGAGPSGGKRVAWAKFAAFPAMGDDLCYPDIVATTNGVYIASVFSGRLRLQKITPAGKMVHPLDKLADLGPASIDPRCPPRLIDTPRGAVVVWRQGKDIVFGLCAALQGGGKPARVGAGQFPAAAWNWQAGRLAVVYVGAGALRMESVDVK